MLQHDLQGKNEPEWTQDTMNNPPEESKYRRDIMKGYRAQFSCGKTEAVTAPGTHGSTYWKRTANSRCI
jgi:hypothetical protein